MSEVSVIEQELLDATKYKGKKGASRENYLAGLVQAVEKMDEDDFDNLSDAAAVWYNDAVAAMNDKDPPPEFADASEEADDESSDEDEDASADGDDDTDADGAADDEEAEDSGAAADDDEDEEGVDSDEEEAPPKKAKTKVVKPAKKDSEPSAYAKAKANKPKTDASRYAHITGEKDRFGVVKGTKTSEAVAMFARPQGATAAQIMEALGGRFYNITRTLAANGHHVEKMEGGVLRITHKDDYGKKVKAGGKKGK